MIDQFISCDWGTSSFRLRLIESRTKRVVKEIISPEGISFMQAEWLNNNQTGKIGFYKSFLTKKIKLIDAESLTIPLIISGMASSSIGMKELPYLSLPFDLKKDQLLIDTIKSSPDFIHDIYLVSGLKTDNDIMRGEETILFGSEVSPNESIFVFPGTHSKHVFVKNGLIADFKTYMTGDFFEAISSRTILASSITKSDLINETIFAKGVNDSINRNLLNAAFHIRTNQIFGKMSAEENYSYLSGLLIGSELKDISSTNLPVVLLSGNKLTSLYEKAFNLLNQNSRLMVEDADKALINAHCKLASQF